MYTYKFKCVYIVLLDSMTAHLHLWHVLLDEGCTKYWHLA